VPSMLRALGMLQEDLCILGWSPFLWAYIPPSSCYHPMHALPPSFSLNMCPPLPKPFSAV